MGKGSDTIQVICTCCRLRSFVGVEFAWGGYLDTDVEILQPIESALRANLVLGIENHSVGTDELLNVQEDGFYKGTYNRCCSFCVQAGFMYSEPHHPFIEFCIHEIYFEGNRQFIKEDGSLAKFVIDTALMIQLTKWGAVYRDETQRLKDNTILYKSNIFATRKSKDQDSILIHWFDQSWDNRGGLKMKIKKFIKSKLYWLYRKQ